MRNFALGFVSALLLIAVIGCTARLMAEGLYLVGSGIALHLDNDSHCNNHFTRGIGLELKVSDAFRLALGGYDNSNCRTSFYGAATYTPIHMGSLHLGLIGGAVTGYRASVMPVGGLAAALERRTWGVNLIYIPPYKDSGNVAWLQFKMPVDWLK